MKTPELTRGSSLKSRADQNCGQSATFEGHAGDVVRVSGEGCNTGSLVLGFTLPNGVDILGPSCRPGDDAVLKQNGTYKLVVNATDGGPDAYHFVFQIASDRAGK